MNLTVKQSDKAHDGNRLHDQLIRAGVVPSLVLVYDDRTEFTIGDEEEEAAREAVANYQPSTGEPAPTAATVIAALAQMNLEGVTTIAGLKAAIQPICDAAAAVVSADVPTP